MVEIRNRLKDQDGPSIFSPWKEINQAGIDAFANASCDRQYIHVDPIRAACGPFDSTIAHGFYILSLLVELRTKSGLAGGSGRTDINYGIERLRFTNPVRVGSKIRAEFRLIESNPKVVGDLIRYAVTVEIEGETKPALVCEWLILNI